MKHIISIILLFYVAAGLAQPVNRIKLRQLQAPPDTTSNYRILSNKDTAEWVLTGVNAITNLADTTGLAPHIGDAFINASADTLGLYNGSYWALFFGGGSTEVADGLTILGDGTGGDPFRVDTSLLVTITRLEDSLAAKQLLIDSLDNVVLYANMPSYVPVPPCEDDVAMVITGLIIDKTISIGDNISGDITFSGAPLAITYVQEENGYAYFEAVGSVDPDIYGPEIEYAGITLSGLLNVVASNPDTVSVLLQDSILVTRVCGAEISRDTIPLGDVLPADNVTGTGTTNRTALWTAANTIGNSYLLQSADALTLDAGKMFRIIGGTTAARPTATTGGLWYNQDDSYPEWSDGISWRPYGFWAKNGTSIYYDDGNVGVGTGSSPTTKVEVRTDNIGTTQDVAYGLSLRNTTSAAEGAQQMSPGILWEGQGWKTNTTAGSQSVRFLVDVLPIQGPAASGEWTLKGSAHTGGYTTILRASNTGNIAHNVGDFQQNTASQSIVAGNAGGLKIRANGFRLYGNSGGSGIWAIDYVAGFSNYYLGHRFTVLSSDVFDGGNSSLVNLSASFAPTSNSYTHAHLWVRPTINQTGTATGITRGVHIDPTIVAADDFRGLEISNTTHKGLWQTGAAVPNYLNGPTGIGVTAPTARLHLPAGTATAGTAPLGFTSGPLLTTPEVGKVEFLTDRWYGTITTGAARKGFAFTDDITAITTGLATNDVPRWDGSAFQPSGITSDNMSVSMSGLGQMGETGSNVPYYIGFGSIGSPALEKVRTSNSYAAFFEEGVRQYALFPTADTITIDTFDFAQRHDAAIDIMVDSIGLSTGGIIVNQKSEAAYWKVDYGFFVDSDEDQIYTFWDVTTDGSEDPERLEGSASRSEISAVAGINHAGRSFIVRVPSGEGIRLCAYGNPGVTASMDISFLSITVTQVTAP